MLIDQVHLTKLIRDPVIVRIVNIVDLASLSILELLEYNLERKEINHALSEGVIVIDKKSPSSSQLNPPQMIHEQANILLSEDSYFYNFLNCKVRLTELGLYILDSIKAEPIRLEQPVDYANQYDLSMFNPPTMPWL